MVSSKHIGQMVMTLVMCLFVPFFSYAQAPYTRVELGANIAVAYEVQDTVSATVVNGEANFFKIGSNHLPATVYYLPDSAFGPIPVLINALAADTLSATMVVDGCRMAWKWELSEAEEDEDIRYLYFSTHENASAEIQPFVCQTVYHNLPDTAVCDEYIWEDTTIITSGIYSRLKRTARGCDSIVTQQVTINHSVSRLVEVTAYDSYTWINGQTYTKSILGPGWDLKTTAGCDSTLTLSLTIRHLKKDTLRVTVCSNQLPYTWRGQDYTEANLYTLDTIKSTTSDVDTLYSLSLTVNETYAVDTVADLCGTSYAWRGQTYTQSGDYPFNGHTQAGCDSIVTLRLTLRKPTTGQETKTAEGSYTWHGVTYTQSGTYTYTTTNAAGCDSVVTLYLTITQKPIIDVDTVQEYFCPKSGIVEHVDTTSNPRIQYVQYVYEKPSRDMYMDGVISDATNAGANVNFRRAEENLDAYYQIPLMPVTAVFWRYQKRGEASHDDVVIEAAQPQWMATGTISIEVQFLCGQHYYGSFTVGSMSEGLEETQSDVQPVKRIENGQVVIIRGGAKYNLLGTRID